MHGFLALLPKGDQESIDAIVILGRGERTRLDSASTASRYWTENRAADVFVSGMTDAPVIANTLSEMGVPQAQIAGERCSQNTWENALFTDIMLDSDKESEILLVTEEAHMLRAFLTFQSAGFVVTPAALESEESQLFSIENAHVLLREYAALATYFVSGKFHQKFLDQQQRRNTASEKIVDWKCEV